ncbi:Methyltransferase [Macrococcoides canis]|uniref:Methyltransferase n=1 Tax=Macrococcoides canis TaxID=1855823 RepID=A0A0D6DR42_9STAP|nr:site-specific DNA-methyltransferase [Macrococcus canis]ARQ05705.1 DNA methylase N-4/N-6 family protein [Macrococcus canis]CDO67625.1 DNA methylase N-4/N-6 family protein [Macrococcus canis]
MNNINKIYHGDCIDILKKFPENFFASCVTDPPYNYEFIGHKWDSEESNRRMERTKNPNSKTLINHVPYGSGLAGGTRNKKWYKKNRDNILEYQKWIEAWGNELFRVLKPGAIIMVFNSTRTISHVQVALENSGFYARDIIVCKKPSGIPKGLNVEKKLEKINHPNPEEWKGWHSALRNEWEAVCVLQKPLINNYINTLQLYSVGLFKTKNHDTDSFQSNIIENYKREKKDVYNTHPTVKSLELMNKLVSLSTPIKEENIVLDPFCGSGTTLLAAKNLGLKYVGIELNEEYIDIANKRLN